VLLTAVAAAAVLGACSSHGSAGVIPAAFSGASGDVRSKPTPKPTATPGKLLFVPHALNFTTVPTLVMRLKEPKYKGKFHFLVTPRHFVKIAPATVKGPSAKITVTSTATNPGTGTITILDDHGGKKNVPVTVTSGVIVIQ
jgi:hypothetical protein